MELWIRSQDKKCLLNTTNLYISRTVGELSKNTYSIYNGNPEQIYYNLGEYLTEERALEVLDEIQQAIRNHCIEMQTDGNPERRWEYYYNTSIVYEMPKE